MPNWQKTKSSDRSMLDMLRRIQSVVVVGRHYGTTSVKCFDFVND